VLTDEEIDANAARYFDQAKLVIDDDPAKLEVRFNGEWLSGLDFAEVLRLTRTTTVARILERDDFAKRYAANAPISVSELLYPLMQAYDSVAVEADVELGGTDQLYNLLTGRDVMEAYGLEPQVALTTPLLLGSDGEKMSKSKGNTIGLTDPPEEQFGRTMRISDDLLPDYYRLVMERDPAEIGDDPMEAKLRLARYVVARSYGDDAAGSAEEHFTRVVRRHEAPDDVPRVVLSPDDVDEGAVYVPGLLVRYMGVSSTSEGRRLIGQGGVKLDGEPVSELTVPLERLANGLVQAGKRRFATFLPPSSE
jgi:tyrosyl-tRNA synthetase